MKILIISGTNPHSEGAFEAANVINYEIVKNLLLSGNHQVSCLTINTKEIKWPDQSIIQKNELIQLGVNFLPDLIIPKKTKNNLSLTKILKIFLANPATLIDGVEYAGLLNEHIKNDTFEIALTVWSEFCTGMTYGLKIPVYAYYGNPDPKVAIANWYRKWKLENNKKSIRNLLKSSLDRIYINFKEIAHLKVMNKLNGVFDVALNDTNYYRKKGIKNVTYIRNMWGDLDYQWKIKKKNLIKGKKIKIIGNVGNLSATGNSFGMFILVTEILPELRKRLGEDNFEIHLLGGGLPSKKLNPAVSPQAQGQNNNI